VKRALVLIVVLALTSAAAALVYQVAARDRDYRILLERGDRALREDQTFAAIEAYSGAIAWRPDSMIAHLRRGETYHRRGDLNTAAHDFQTAAKLDATATRPLEELGDVRYIQQRYNTAIEIYEQYLRLDDRAARVTYKLALARFRYGDLKGALAALAAALRLNDRMADAYYLQGLCFREQDRTVEAEQALEKAIAVSPGFIAAREELADLYASLGRRADELAHLQVLAGLDPGRVERQVAVGVAHARWFADPQDSPARRSDHADLAVLTLGGVLERIPDQTLAYNTLGRVWLDIARARNDGVALNKAVEALERIASTNSASSETLTLYGRALLQSGRMEMAERILQQATGRLPVDPAAFLQYATAAEQQNHPEAARRALIQYGSLVVNEEGFVPRAARIAALSLKLNDPPTAVDWLQRASAASANDVRLLGLLADAQIKAGDRTAAEATIGRGLEKDPRNVTLLALRRRLR
jgi:tetratricopeptide (TPR) repeat protein